MKASWKGTISFALVTIQVELVLAVKPHTIGFKLLHKKCHTPLHYQRWCPHCNQEVEWENVVKGLKLEDGSYFILTPEHLAELRPSRTNAISILEFIDSDLVEPVYFDSHYYVVPAKATEKAYVLLAAALQKMNKTAIGQFVLKDKEYMCAVRPYRNGLLLTTLNYSYEVREVPAFTSLEDKPKVVAAAELKLAEQLINKFTRKKFDISAFKDTFVQKLLSRIKQKGKKVIIQPVEKEKKPAPTKGPSLMQTLKQSLRSPKSRATEARAR